MSAKGKTPLNGNPCPHCQGSGSAIIHDEGLSIEVDCPHCKGTGVVNSTNACDDCKGSGSKIVTVDEVMFEVDCPTCKGSGLKQA